MENQIVLSEESLALKMNLLNKAMVICRNKNAIPEIDVPRLVKKELPGLEDYLAGKKDAIVNFEHIEIARNVIRESLAYYLELINEGRFKISGGVTGTPKTSPGLDYYDNRRDFEAQYRGKYGVWFYD